MCSILGLWYCTPAIVQDKLQGIQQSSLLSSTWLERKREYGNKGCKPGCGLKCVSIRWRLFVEILEDFIMKGHWWLMVTLCFFFTVLSENSFSSLTARWCSAKHQHVIFFCWIHYLGPTINIALLVVPGVLIPTAHQLWLRGTVTASVGSCRKWKLSPVCFFMAACCGFHCQYLLNTQTHQRELLQNKKTYTNRAFVLDIPIVGLWIYLRVETVSKCVPLLSTSSIDYHVSPLYGGVLLIPPLSVAAWNGYKHSCLHNMVGQLMCSGVS